MEESLYFNQELNERRLLSPKMDFVFQVLFGEVGNEEITKDFLEAVLKEKITEIDLGKNPILRRTKVKGKMGILDVIVEINKKEVCNIEMQIAKREDIKKRLLYYWGRAYTRNLGKGEDYGELKRTIVILIAGFELDGLEELGYFTKWNLIERENRKQILTDDIEIDIIELPKIHNGNTENEDGLLEWLYFLENPESEGVERIMKKNKGIKKAKEKLEEISSDIIMQRLADWEEAAERDAISARKTAIKEGLKEGREEGLKEGREEGLKEGREEGIKEGKKEGKKEGIEEGKKEGIEEGKQQLIIEMLKNGVDEDFIVKISGMSKEKILQIKEKITNKE